VAASGSWIDQMKLGGSQVGREAVKLRYVTLLLETFAMPTKAKRTLALPGENEIRHAFADVFEKSDDSSKVSPQQVADSLAHLYTDLNGLWAEAEKKLREMFPPRESWTEYRIYGHDDQFRECLGLVKYRSEWRICHGFYDAHQCSAPQSWKTVAECSVAERVALVEHIEALRDAIVAEAAKSISEVQGAVAKLSDTLLRL
jgi:hypothetical protein